MKGAPNMPKRSFFDYQYRDGPNYDISFDPHTGQPIVSSMDAITMGNKLTEIHNEISKRKLDEKDLAKQNYNALRDQQVLQKKLNT